MNFNNNIRIIIFSSIGPIYPISVDEIKFAERMAPNRSELFKRSRGCMRRALSYIFDIPPLDIPLNAPPGMPPKLPIEFGFVSLSHCIDVILIGWSNLEIGVDIESKNRKIESEKIIKRFYTKKELCNLSIIPKKKLIYEFLKYWVLKEACIKWDQGTLLKGIKRWEINMSKKSSFNSSQCMLVNTQLLKFNNWYIGVASEKNLSNIELILCNELSIK